VKNGIKNLDYKNLAENFIEKMNYLIDSSSKNRNN